MSDDTTPTIVLVHGAWADATGFDGIIRALHAGGHRVVGVATPLRSLSIDARYTADVLRSIAGPIVLAAHSWGGAVATNAATGNPNVKALVYINGWVPDEGDSIGELAGMHEGSEVLAAIRPVPFTNPDGSAGVDFYIDQDAFHSAFAGDVDADTARVMAAAQRPWTQAALEEPSGPPAWKSIPSWYLLGTEDRAIPPATQRFMAERAGAEIVEAAVSHAPMVSQPDLVTELILRAVAATSRVTGRAEAPVAR